MKVRILVLSMAALAAVGTLTVVALYGFGPADEPVNANASVREVAPVGELGGAAASASEVDATWEWPDSGGSNSVGATATAEAQDRMATLDARSTLVAMTRTAWEATATMAATLGVPPPVSPQPTATSVIPTLEAYATLVSEWRTRVALGEIPTEQPPPTRPWVQLWTPVPTTVLVTPSPTVAPTMPPNPKGYPGQYVCTGPTGVTLGPCPLP